jgi:hypothetical protein
MRLTSTGLGIGTSSPSDDVEISTSADAKGLTIKNSGNNRPYLNFDANRSAAGNNLGQVNFKWNGTDVARIIGVAGSDTTNKDDGHITFQTASAGSTNEAMRIDSSGVVNIGTASGTQPSYFNSFLNVQNNGSTGSHASVTITSGSGGYAGLHFGDSDNGRIGQVSYNNSDNSLLFTANNSERMRIDSNGDLLVGKTTTGFNSYGVRLSDDTNQFVVNNAVVVQYNRRNGDGEILGLYADDGRIGGVGVKNSKPYFVNPSNFGIRLANNALVATDESGTNETGASDLGAIDVRWKSLYLSGTIGANSSTAFSSMDGRLMFDNDYSSSALGPNKVVLQAEGNWVGGLGVSNNFLDIYTGGGIRFNKSASQTSYSAPMTLDASGRLGIGKVPSSSTGSMLQVEGNDGIAIRRSGQTNHFVMRPLSSSDGDGIRFTQEGVGDRMRIDSSGDTTLYQNVRAGTTGAGNGVVDLNGRTGSFAIDYIDSGGTRRMGVVAGSGNLQNANNSYGSTSDQKLKENITDASSQWDDIKALRVRKYSMKADALNAPNQLGVIAQELETSGMSGLVYETPDKDSNNNDLGTTTKSVKYSILYMKAVKALQEAMDRIETLEAKVTALENA